MIAIDIIHFTKSYLNFPIVAKKSDTEYMTYMKLIWQFHNIKALLLLLVYLNEIENAKASFAKNDWLNTILFDN